MSSDEIPRLAHIDEVVVRALAPTSTAVQRRIVLEQLLHASKKLRPLTGRLVDASVPTATILK